MWDVRNHSNKKLAAVTTQPAQEQGKTWKKTNRNQVLLAEKKMEEIEKHERFGHVGATSTMEEYFKNIPRGYEQLGVS